MSKKQEIILTARELMNSKGYRSTSISDILEASEIGKGQFYYYFSSKYDLGLAVVENVINEWETHFFSIFETSEEPAAKLNEMLDKNLAFYTDDLMMSGCPIGNLACEMSEHDETFRQKIQYVFDRWIGAVEEALTGMVKEGRLDANMDTKKNAQAIVAMVEGGILLMKNQQDAHFLSNVFDVIRAQFNLTES
ncbi:TetR/AcrR family transcriptional regulator [Bacillaceae bacterium SIJ1]|uniref:TetR/AcrR family transcriptional regulator n=1 Tax=Litoribacterium kuwaitense TaxID=1398745 RepID=UPI0013EDD3D7|nr:TetR/AcrR family transcriptional regulator [Litoribacterium kuwaitense]NGP46814.1 TetR/AcrR family transcriptional regulator [Litoribacterium kuwaitense]